MGVPTSENYRTLTDNEPVVVRIDRSSMESFEWGPSLAKLRGKVAKLLMNRPFAYTDATMMVSNGHVFYNVQLPDGYVLCVPRKFVTVVPLRDALSVIDQEELI